MTLDREIQLYLPRRTKTEIPKSLWREASLEPVPGRILIFPAWVWHGVEPNESNDIRISVSFNFTQEGFLMIIHKDKIMFRECNKKLNTQEGKDLQKNNDGYKKLRDDIGEKGMINPILCIEEDNMYKICIGMRRFIAGLELGMEEFEVKVLPNDSIDLSVKEKQQYRHTDVQ